MFTYNYKINKNLHGRAATQLNWDLNQLTSSIYIINSEKRQVNGKSLVGLLQANIKENEVVTIILDNKEDIDKAKIFFNKIGKEVT